MPLRGRWQEIYLIPSRFPVSPGGGSRPFETRASFRSHYRYAYGFDPKPLLWHPREFMGEQEHLFDVSEPGLPEPQQTAELRELIAQYRVKMNKLTGQLMYLERQFRRASDSAAEMVSGFVDGFLGECSSVPETVPTSKADDWYSSAEVYECVSKMYYAGRNLRRVAKKIVTTRRHFYRDLQIVKQRHQNGESAFDREANLRLQQRRQWTQKERERIWIQSERVCHYCRCKLESFSGDIMHVDHIVPVVVGGTDEIENLTAACATCNLSKNAKSEDEFLASLLKLAESAENQPLLSPEDET